jgi:hypothetical protein
MRSGRPPPLQRAVEAGLSLLSQWCRTAAVDVYLVSKKGESLAQSGRLVLLEGLRGVAAATVLFHPVGIASNHTRPLFRAVRICDRRCVRTATGRRAHPIVGDAENSPSSALSGNGPRFPVRLRRRCDRRRPPPSVPIIHELLCQLAFWPTLDGAHSSL